MFPSRGAIIWLSLFFSNVSLAELVFPYYQNAWSVCSDDAQYMAEYAMTKLPYEHRKLQEVDAVSSTTQLKYTYSHWKVNSSTGTPYDFQTVMGTAAQKKSKTCPDNTFIKFEGCTVTCDTTNPCDSKKDQEISLQPYCGISKCPANGKFYHNGTWAYCTTGEPIRIPTDVPLKVIQNHCEAVLVIADIGTHYVNQGETSSEAPIYCDATYKYNGTYKKEADTDIDGNTSGPDGNGSKMLPGVIAPSSDGGCPDGYKHGQINQVDACLKESGDSGSSGGDGSGSGSGTGGTGDGSGSGTGTGGDGSGTGDGDGECTNPNPDGTCPGTDNGTGEDCANPKPDGTCPDGAEGSYGDSSECTTPPTCSGDTLLCGMMNENWKQACSLKKGLFEMPQSMKDKLGKAGTGKENSSELSESKGTAESGLDELLSNMNLTTASCLGDYGFIVMNQAIEIKLSEACDIFKIIRLFIWLGVYLLCARLLLTAF